MKYKSLILVLTLLCFAGCNGNDISVNEYIDVPPEIDVTYSKGNANAKVTIIEYSDYECSFCGRFTLDILPLLQNDYIETGKVQFIFKDFPIPNHKYAQKASEATYCAGEQNEDYFWEMHIKSFENQDNLDKEDLISMAEEIGVNTNAFTSCLDSDKYKNLVLRNRQDGLKAEIEGTPTILINDIKLIGVPQYDNLKKVIETELKK